MSSAFRDMNTMASAFNGPGRDTRQWVSDGVVMPDTPEQRSVVWDPTLGPLVHVQLIPSGTEVMARVSMGIVGNQEGEWMPFIGGDPVLVVIPQGDENSSCTIIGRTPNQIDKFPTTVAGQDVTQNNFSFRRQRPPHILETENGWLVRHATTGAQLGIDRTGQVIINDADGNRMFFGADAMGFTTADGTTTIQATADNVVTVTAGDATGTTNLVIDKGQFQILTPGQVKIGSAGLGPLGHAVTAEQVISFFYQVLSALPPPIPAAASAALLAAVAATGVNPIPAPMKAALDALMANPPDPTGQKTGFGRAGVTL